MTNEEIQQKVLSVLRDARERDGNCFHGLEWLAQKVGCDPIRLYDWDNDCGVMFDLYEKGLIGMDRSKHPSFIAIGEMHWGEW